MSPRPRARELYPAHDFLAGSFQTVTDADVGLIGDIGATNARFALVEPGAGLRSARVYALTDAILFMMP